MLDFVGVRTWLRAEGVQASGFGALVLGLFLVRLNIVDTTICPEYLTLAAKELPQEVWLLCWNVSPGIQKVLERLV